MAYHLAAVCYEQRRHAADDRPRLGVQVDGGALVDGERRDSGAKEEQRDVGVQKEGGPRAVLAENGPAVFAPVVRAEDPVLPFEHPVRLQVRQLALAHGLGEHHRGVAGRTALFFEQVLAALLHRNHLVALRREVSLHHEAQETVQLIGRTRGAGRALVALAAARRERQRLEHDFLDICGVALRLAVDARLRARFSKRWIRLRAGQGGDSVISHVNKEF